MAPEAVEDPQGCLLWAQQSRPRGGGGRVRAQIRGDQGANGHGHAFRAQDQAGLARQ